MKNRLDKENFQVISVHTPEFENEKNQGENRC